MYQPNDEINKMGGWLYGCLPAVSRTISQPDADGCKVWYGFPDSCSVSEKVPLVKIQSMQVSSHKRIVDNPPPHILCVGVDFISLNPSSGKIQVYCYQGGDAYPT